MSPEFRWLSSRKPLGEGSIFMGTPDFPLYTKLQVRYFYTDNEMETMRWTEWQDIPVEWVLESSNDP